MNVKHKAVRLPTILRGSASYHQIIALGDGIQSFKMSVSLMSAIKRKIHIAENSDNLVAHHKQDGCFFYRLHWMVGKARNKDLLNASVSGLML